MNKYILLLVLISGFLSGYLVGDYRGRDARESLERAVATGKTLASERETALVQLKAELDSISDKYHGELDTIRKDSASKASEWRRSGNSLNARINHTTARLAESDTRLKSLVAQREAASGSSKASLDQKIALLQKERAGLQQEIESNTCLRARVPHDVFDALNETNTGGKK